MTREEATNVLEDVRAYLSSRASLENEILAGHTFIDICNAIKTLGQEPKWISVSERLPEEGEEVLASCYDTYGKKVVIARYKGKKYGFTCSLVSAWMPLPEPYKVESEE